MNRILQAIKARLLGKVDNVVRDLQRGVARLEALAEGKRVAADSAAELSVKHWARAKSHEAEADRAERVASKLKSLVQ